MGVKAVLQQANMAVNSQGRQLIATLLPDQQYELDWESNGLLQVPELAESPLESSLYHLYRRQPDDFLLALALTPPTEGLSESLRFLQHVGMAFVKGMARHPEIERLRDGATISLEAEHVDRWLTEAPYLIGAEYLNRSFIEALWNGLHQGLTSSLEKYNGTVSQWFAINGPDLQPIGRVYFHLVESKEAASIPSLSYPHMRRKNVGGRREASAAQAGACGIWRE